MTFPRSVVLSFLARIAVLCSSQQTRLLYQYPTVGTWLENAAVRSNGSILLTSLDSPGGLHSLNPFDRSTPVLITNNFDELNSTLGIVETTEDIFYVIASNFSLSETAPGTQKGSNAIYKVVFEPEECEEEVTVSLLARMPDAVFLNGLTRFNDTLLLAADSGLGLVWGIDTETGASKVVVMDPLMDPLLDDGFMEGINGVHSRDGTLYFTSSQQRIFAKVEIDGNGQQRGPAVKIATALTEQGVAPRWDDFALDRSLTYAYVATEAGNGVQRIDLSDGTVSFFAGNVNSTEIAEPTAVVFGRTEEDGDTLYSVTAGGLAFPVYMAEGLEQVGAQVVAVDIL